MFVTWTESYSMNQWLSSVSNAFYTLEHLPTVTYLYLHPLTCLISALPLPCFHLPSFPIPFPFPFPSFSTRLRQYTNSWGNKMLGELSIKWKLFGPYCRPKDLPGHTHTPTPLPDTLSGTLLSSLAPRIGSPRLPPTPRVPSAVLTVVQVSLPSPLFDEIYRHHYFHMLPLLYIIFTHVYWLL